MSSGFIIPAYNPGPALTEVLRELLHLIEARKLATPLWVIDDGSTDDTAARAQALGVTVLRHPTNLGKGRALLTGFEAAHQQGVEQVITLDADGQHPPREALRLLDSPWPKDALVLGVRDLRAAGAPKSNQRSNAFSNRVLSLFTGLELRDTQCGLRRYPVRQTLALGLRATGYDLEAEVLLRAAYQGIPIEQVDIDVVYPPEGQRLSHFDVVRDPARIVRTVLKTFFEYPEP